MREKRRWYSALLILWAAIFMVCGGTLETLAAAKSINKVTINVNVDLTAGDELPDLSTDKGTGANVYSDNNRYVLDEATWTNSNKSDVKIGGTYTMKVYLTAEDSDEYAFKGSYKSSNVSVKGADFVSASRKNNDQLVVTLRTKPLKGTFDAPDDAEWKNNQRGMAVWDKVDGVDYYEVNLYRGSSSEYKVKEYKGNKIDFYPYMTKAGSYSFKVRSVPKSSDQNYAKSSDWAESDEIYIAKEDVSDGSGRVDYNNPGSASNNSTSQVGWIQDGSRWWYRYPDGTFQKDSWLRVNNIWYLFDKDGWMLTGWQQKDGRWYYLDPSGAMKTGWVKASDGWYYLNPGPEGVEGAMLEKQWLDYNNKKYYLGEVGRMYEGWKQVGGSWYYFYPGEGSMAVNTIIGGMQIGSDGIWHKPN